MEVAMVDEVIEAAKSIISNIIMIKNLLVLKFIKII
jgi:hypothetical protein